MTRHSKRSSACGNRKKKWEFAGDISTLDIIDVSLVYDFFSTPIRTAWEKLKPIVEWQRKRSGRPRYYEWFEYLYNEMQKREQGLQQTHQ